MRSANPTPITPPRVPLTDPRTGLIDRSWYMFFLSLFHVASDAVDASTGPDANSLLASYDIALQTLAQNVGTQPVEINLAEIQKQLEELSLSPAVIERVSSFGNIVFGISVGASPFTYVNTTGYGVNIIVSGGGVSKLQFSRDGATYYSTGSFYGFFYLAPNDRLKVTYATAPTMTGVPA